MNSNKAAGYNSKQREGVSTPTAPVLDKDKKKDKSEEENFKELEEEVHWLLEASAELKLSGKLTDGLNKAKEAASKEKKIRQIRESTGNLD